MTPAAPAVVGERCRWVELLPRRYYQQLERQRRSKPVHKTRSQSFHPIIFIEIALAASRHRYSKPALHKRTAVSSSLPILLLLFVLLPFNKMQHELQHRSLLEHSQKEEDNQREPEKSYLGLESLPKLRSVPTSIPMLSSKPYFCCLPHKITPRKRGVKESARDKN